MSNKNVKKWIKRVGPFSIIAFLRISLVLAILSTFSMAATEDEINLQAGKEKYFQGDFKAAIMVLQNIIFSSSANDVQKAEAYLYMGASTFSLGQLGEAKGFFQASISLRPKYKMPETEFSPELVTFYREVKEELVGSLEITSDPPGAKVYIEGEEVGLTPYSEEDILRDRILDVKIEKYGYGTKRKQIKIENLVNRVPFTLQPAYGSLRILSSPPGALIEIDTIKVGKTPWEQKLCIGEYNLKIYMDGYSEVLRSVKVEEDTLIQINITLIESPGYSAVQQAWTEYERKLKKNRILRYSSLSLGLLSGAGALILKSMADDSYNRYLGSVSLTDINKNYNDYEKYANLHNVFVGTSIASFGLATIFIFTSPQKPSESPEDYEMKGLSFELRENLQNEELMFLVSVRF